MTTFEEAKKTLSLVERDGSLYMRRPSTSHNGYSPNGENATEEFHISTAVAQFNYMMYAFSDSEEHDHSRAEDWKVVCDWMEEQDEKMASLLGGDKDTWE